MYPDRVRLEFAVDLKHVVQQRQRPAPRQIEEPETQQTADGRVGGRYPHRAAPVRAALGAEVPVLVRQRRKGHTAAEPVGSQQFFRHEAQGHDWPEQDGCRRDCRL